MARVVIVSFTDEEYSKLDRLSARQNVSIQALIRRFAQACNADGNQWEHPDKAKKETAPDET